VPLCCDRKRSLKRSRSVERQLQALVARCDREVLRCVGPAFGTGDGDTAITGDAGGILNTYGAPLINVDGRCLVPLPEGEGIGGHLLGGPKAACNIAPVEQFQAPQKLL
jgi:hypothetical protein